MSVNQPDRKTSKREFDRVYYKIYDDAVRLCEYSFGASEEQKQSKPEYLRVSKERVMRVVSDIGTHIRIANSIFPKEGNMNELEERRIQQEKALGLCFDLITKYQLIMHTLHIQDDKYTEEIKHISHEIGCLKSWRTSDNKRFLG